MCGEQVFVPLQHQLPQGSPPRVRGTEHNGAIDMLREGITPACAGNSHFRGEIHDIRKDHPRVCGEQSNVHMYGSTNRGSPPRVRGTGGAGPMISGPGRITPACAGNSCSTTLATALP